MLEHFGECIKQAKASRQQAIQINIFTAVLYALKVKYLLLLIKAIQRYIFLCRGTCLLMKSDIYTLRCITFYELMHMQNCTLCWEFTMLFYLHLFLTFSLLLLKKKQSLKVVVTAAVVMAVVMGWLWLWYCVVH